MNEHPVLTLQESVSALIILSLVGFVRYRMETHCNCVMSAADTADQMRRVATGMDGKRLRYRDLVAE